MARKKATATPVRSPGYGDRLARGAGSATFGSMSYIKQDKWDSIFGPAEPVKKKRK
jgi:hypothetical protein